LIGQIATLLSVYHKPPEAFVVLCGAGDIVGWEEDKEHEAEHDVGEGNLLDIRVIDLNSGSCIWHFQSLMAMIKS
jgi:hypothetical protein